MRNSSKSNWHNVKKIHEMIVEIHNIAGLKVDGQLMNQIKMIEAKGITAEESSLKKFRDTLGIAKSSLQKS